MRCDFNYAFDRRAEPRKLAKFIGVGVEKEGFFRGGSRTLAEFHYEWANVTADMGNKEEVLGGLGKVSARGWSLTFSRWKTSVAAVWRLRATLTATGPKRQCGQRAPQFPRACLKLPNARAQRAGAEKEIHTGLLK